jgi:GH15 family glucan-1,4-alpha-glucosidase
VRIGNAAVNQHQLDVYGELMDTLHLARQIGIEPHEPAWALQRHWLEFLESGWREPDEGIWEIRRPRQHFTHSKVMAWVAVDRAIKSAELFGLPANIDKWKRLRAEIHAEVCEKGYDSERNTFTQYYGSKALDAGLLMLALVGFLTCEDKRVLGTVAAIEREPCEDGFVLRYRGKGGGPVDGLPPGEGHSWPEPSGWPTICCCSGRQRTRVGALSAYWALVTTLAFCPRNTTPRPSVW